MSSRSLPERDIAGRTLICAGASGGIGFAICKAFQAAGAKVIGLDLAPPPEPLDLFQTCDLTDEAALGAALAGAQADYAVHAAGKVFPGTLAQTSLADWTAALSINLTSAFLFAKAIQQPLAQRCGSMVLVSSSNGLNGGSALSGPGYAAAKGGIVTLTRYLAKEWAAQKIRVNAIAPGPVDTPMLDRFSLEEKQALAQTMLTGALTQPEEIAQATLHLLTAPSMTGTVMNVTGGLVLD